MTPATRDMSAHAEHLLYGARRLTRNEADARDLVQDTYVRALEAMMRTGEIPGNMRAWLSVIMRHVWFNVVRGRRRQTALPADAFTEQIDNSMVETRASYPQFERAWEQISVTARSIATQCLLDGEAYEVVSDRMGVTVATIATSIHRTRRQLRATMFDQTEAPRARAASHSRRGRPVRRDVLLVGPHENHLEWRSVGVEACE